MIEVTLRTTATAQGVDVTLGEPGAWNADPRWPSTVTLYLQDAPSGGGGGGVYPLTGHVRSPDAYGPTGSEYVGTEVLPAVADVKVGIGFGENGSEFVGVMEQKRRVRVIG